MPEYDVLIIGAGPVGLAAACAAQDAGLAYLCLDKGGICHYVSEYPIMMRFYSPAEDLAIGGIPFPVANDEKPRREDALAYYRNVVAARGLNVRTWEGVESVHRSGAGFLVSTLREPDRDGGFSYRSRAVILATGFWGQPRTLEVPGSRLQKVAVRYREAAPYYGKEALVVGGGNSAAEAAMALAAAGSRVSLSSRRSSPSECKLRPFVLRELELRLSEGKLTPLYGTEVVEIKPQEVVLKRSDGTVLSIPNDFVFALLGYRANRPFLEGCGIRVAEDDRPEYHEETFETCVPWLYVAGGMTREGFIFNGRERVARIVAHLRGAL
ncbi:MAG: NAD(P)-binding domain-containing protein [Armatimonadetes bacterium]|nr:NAD(P)-binding domain-containing protein [Armatimonadota bacterium]